MAEKICLLIVSEEGEYGRSRIATCYKGAEPSRYVRRKIPEEPSLVDCGGPRTKDVLEDLDRISALGRRNIAGCKCKGKSLRM